VYDGKGLQVSAAAAVCVLSAEAHFGCIVYHPFKCKTFFSVSVSFKPLKKTNRGNKRLIYIKTGVNKNVQRKIN